MHCELGQRVRRELDGLTYCLQRRDDGAVRSVIRRHAGQNPVETVWLVKEAIRVVLRCPLLRVCKLG